MNVVVFKVSIKTITVILRAWESDTRFGIFFFLYFVCDRKQKNCILRLKTNYLNISREYEGTERDTDGVGQDMS